MFDPLASTNSKIQEVKPNTLFCYLEPAIPSFVVAPFVCSKTTPGHTAPPSAARQERSLVIIQNSPYILFTISEFSCVAICMKRPVSNIEGQITKDSMTKPVPAILVSSSGASATILMTCER